MNQFAPTMPESAAVKAMFGRIAGRYDLANRLLSGGLDVLWRRRLVREVAQIGPNNVVDLATGSGDVAFALRRGIGPGVKIVGMDFCQPMLDEAEAKKAKLPTRADIEFRIGDLLDLPLGEDTTDAITISFGLRNAADRDKALREMRRVLRKNSGVLFVLEFSQPYRWFAPVYFFYLKQILPLLAKLFTGDRDAYDYLCGSIEKYPDRDAISDEILRAGFVSVRAVPLTLGTVALHIARA
jgi:demethylmenaquinone methyltransferase/2-methoxy-6-polyprenyl-1,4-benzoquinol methylase